MTNTASEPILTWITPLFAVTSELRSGDFAWLAQRGVKSVMSNRPDGEESGQMLAKREAALAWRAGLMFRHVPAVKHELFTDGVVEAMADALAELEGPVVAHCKSGLRSAIVWAAASARSQSVDCVLLALEKAGFDLDIIRDDLDAQADRRRWLGRSAALDCASAGAVERLPAKPSRDAA
jgi:sulfide:quinone oxidoreductase